MQCVKANFIIFPCIFIRSYFIFTNIAADDKFDVWILNVRLRVSTLTSFLFHSFNLSAITSTPSLLNPIRLISALSFGKRNNLGLSFPACGKGVTVPISTNQNPMLPVHLNILHFYQNRTKANRFEN